MLPRTLRLWALSLLGAVSCASPARAPSPNPTTAAPATATADASPNRGPTQKRTIGAVTFAYEARGDGVPIVFLHGNPTDRRSMVPRFEPLFASGSAGSWRRIYPDLPGMGETPGSPTLTSVDDYLDAISAFIDEETGGKRFVLVGMSFGGYLALGYATKHPERLLGLALIASGLETSGAPHRTPPVVSEPGVLDGEPPDVVGILNGASTVHTAAVRDLMKRDVVTGVRAADRAFLRRTFAQPFKNNDEVQKVTFAGPALIVFGKQDGDPSGARTLGERFPRATYAQLDRAAHAVMIEQGELVRALVGEWLGRVREGMGEKYPGPPPR